jgi:hypothetical protein
MYHSPLQEMRTEWVVEWQPKMSTMTIQVRQVVVRCGGNGSHHQDSNWHCECGIVVESERDCLQLEEPSTMVVKYLSRRLRMVAMARVPCDGPFSIDRTRRVSNRSKVLRVVGTGGPRERLERAVLQLRKPCSPWFETNTRSQRLYQR